MVMKESFEAVAVDDRDTMSKRRFRRFVDDLKLVPADTASFSTDSTLSREVTLDDVNRVLDVVVDEDNRLNYAGFCKALAKLGNCKYKPVVQAARSQSDRNATETVLAVLGSRWALCRYQLVPYLESVGVDLSSVRAFRCC
jgi:uncharacterized protein YggL (DUF469 family)